MPSPTTAINIIIRGMQKIGALALAETPSADEANVGLEALNDVLERWSIESYAVYGSLPEVFATVSGQAIYTVGTGGNWNTDRPVSVNGMFATYGGVNFPVSPWTYDEYSTVGLPSQQQPFPDRYVFISDAPLGRIILYPTPQFAIPISVDIPRILTQIPTIETVMALPPGYANALIWAVAAEMAPVYGGGRDVNPQARAALALIKRVNRQSPVATFDNAVYGFAGYRGGFGPVVIS